MRLPPALRGFLAASVLFTLLCLGTEAFCRWALHWGDPYTFPLLHTYYTGGHQQILFSDFHQFFVIFPAFHSRAFYTGVTQLSYPAPAVVVYKLFLIPQPYRFHGTGTIARYGAALLVCSWLLAFGWYRALLRRGLSWLAALGFVAGVYVFSFGFWFEFLQGNIEWVIWVILCVAIWGFCQEHFKTAAILIGLAASMKLFPIIYLGLFLPVKRFREVAFTLVTAVISTVVSLWLVCPDIAYSWHHTLIGLTQFEHESVVAVVNSVVGFDHSLFGLLKLVLTSLFGTGGPKSMLGLYVLVVALGGMVLFFTRIRHLPVPNQVLSLSIAAILLPPISLDYTLLHLYPGLVLLSFFAVRQAHSAPLQRNRGLVPALLLLAFILSPQSELIWHGVRYAGQAKALALLALGYVILRYPFRVSGLPVTGEDSLEASASRYGRDQREQALPMKVTPHA